jgi:hypothetical protein
LSNAHRTIAWKAPAPEAETGWQWLSTRQLIADAVALASQVPRDVVGVLGIPRSGMLPATTIATLLHLPLFTFQDRQIVRAVNGITSAKRSQVPLAQGRILVVDDSVHKGTTMVGIREALHGVLPAPLFAAVYVTPWAKCLLDLWQRCTLWPFFAEWNLPNNYGWAPGTCWDYDGIIVHDEESGARPGSPYLVPRAYPLQLIATGRHESHRAHVEASLRYLGVRWERLEMMAEHGNAEAIARHKAKHYGSNANFNIFLESDPWQAERIEQLSGKAVVCPRIERCFGKTAYPGPTVPLAHSDQTTGSGA